MTIITTGRGLPNWSQGTASVANGSEAVSFSGANLVSTDPTSGALLYVAGTGDMFVAVNGAGAPIGSAMIWAVTDANDIVLAEPWPYASQVNTAYAIIRMSFPQSGTVAKAIQDMLAMGSDSNPEISTTWDDGTARLKAKLLAGVPTLSVGATGTADSALLPGIQFSPMDGHASFPNGMAIYAPGERNRVINGGFDIWQGGATFSIASGDLYTADQWVARSGTSVPVTVSKVVAPPGFSGQNAINLQATGIPSGTYLSLYQKFESQMISDLDSNYVSVSFDVNGASSAGALSAYVALIANTGPDNGTWSNVIGTQIFTLPVGSMRVKLLFPPSQTAGLKNGGMIYISFTQTLAAGNPNVTIGAVQLEKGAVANPFSVRPSAQEWLLCQRYYRPIPLQGPSMLVESSNAILVSASFPSLWEAPSFILAKTSVAAAAFDLIAGSNWVSASGLTAMSGAAGTNSLSFAWYGFSGLTIGQQAVGNTPSVLGWLSARL